MPAVSTETPCFFSSDEFCLVACYSGDIKYNHVNSETKNIFA